MKKKIGIFIPARYGSTRLPGKPLLKINGKTIIRYVYERCQLNSFTDDVFVLTDNNKIVEEVKQFGKVFLTPEYCPSGTDRIGYAVNQYKLDYDILVNVQGDEPLINSKIIDKGIELLQNDNSAVAATLATPFKNNSEADNPNSVKVIFDKNNYAIYFSRAKIPYLRDNDSSPIYYKHIGIYIYKKNFLLKYLNMAETYLEKTEKLEQLRIIENGYKIKIAVTDYDSIGIDTKEDFDKVKKNLENK